MTRTVSFASTMQYAIRRRLNFARYFLFRLKKVRLDKIPLASTHHLQRSIAISLLDGTGRPFQGIGPSPSADTIEVDSDGSDSPWDISDDSDDDDGRPGPTSQRGPGGLDGPMADLMAATQSLNPTAQLLGSLKYTIVCFYRLPLRKPVPIDRMRDYARRDTSLCQHFDVMHARDKFPKADERLTSRLGKLISLRRHLLEYSRSHSERLRQHLPPEGGDPLFPGGSRGLSRNMATTTDQASVISDKRTLHTRATTLKPTEHVANVEALYAPSIPETTVSTAVSTYTTSQKLHFPPRPQDEDGHPLSMFECPFCGLVKHIPLERTRSWE